MDELNTPMVMPPEESIPDWYDGKRINEVLFCQQFLKKHPMKCVRGRLFTVDLHNNTSAESGERSRPQGVGAFAEP